LQIVSLDTGLIARQCSQCFGHWISSENYWEWLDYREQQQQQQRSHLTQPTHDASNMLSISDRLLPVVDNATANFCADCARLMTKAKVGRGLSFYLDRCSHCHGVWLDQNEWENLKQLELHHQIHYMFSSAWQFSVRQEKVARSDRARTKIPQKTPA